MQTKTSIERLRELLPDVFEPKAQTGQLYLRFRLGSTINATLPLNRVVETLQVTASSITPIPNMPASVLGLMGNQGKVFWAIDLAHLLGVEQGPHRPRHYDMVILETHSTDQDNNSLWLGLYVQQIQNTLRLTADEVQPPISHQGEHFMPYLKGQLQQQGQEILLLDVDAITNAQDLYSN